MISNLITSVGNQIQRTPTGLTILAGILLACYQHWVGPLPMLYQLTFCTCLLLLVGIPHGALDHLLEQERTLREKRPFSLPHFILRYVLMIAVYGLGWLIFPVLSLSVFLLISAWHFGETDLENAPDDRYWSVSRLVTGGFVLAFILLSHAVEVTPILSRIIQNDPRAMHLWGVAALHANSLLRGWATLVVVLAMLALGHQPIRLNGWRLARLSIVLLLTYLLPLLPAFMLYFGGWHSLSSFGVIQSYMQQPGKPTLTIWKLWRQSIPLTILAFGFMMAGAGIWQSYTPQFDPLPYLFILLSTITLPHIQVMHQLDLLRK